MHWEKRGLIFAPKYQDGWMCSHAQVPLTDIISDQVIRIYFGTRDNLNRTRPTYIEVNANQPERILYAHDQPVMEIGALGSFDDCGVMPSQILNVGGVKYLLYTGWNTSTTVPYRNSIGLASSDDDGQTFTRLYQGPILDRTHNEPHFCATPFVLIENGIWRMWYLSCTKWMIYDNRPEPFYHIKYAESADGTHWNRSGRVCIDFKDSDEGGLARPTIIKDDDGYKMWYCYRGSRSYRTDMSQSYRVGYAESDDGIYWQRNDDKTGIDTSVNGWDSEMIAYPFVYCYSNKKYMLFNGNGFGKSGFGYAVLAEDEG